tara:strand:- start:33214 stop:33393 length:180 start_codon:yes stop_codon:yes gene_type:complete
MIKTIGRPRKSPENKSIVIQFTAPREFDKNLSEFVGDGNKSEFIRIAVELRIKKDSKIK